GHILPARPEDQLKENQRDNKMWDLLVSCWGREPNARPSAVELLKSLKTIYKTEI
ncbi:hypothetical protein FRC11_014155, partial [Ceratobasidium sp. 423]